MNTLVPIGMVITLAGGVWWAADLTARTKTNTESIAEIHTDVRQLKEDVAAIRERLGSNRSVFVEKP